MNVNPAYRAHEVAYALEQSGVSALVSASAFKTSDYGAILAEVQQRADCTILLALKGFAQWCPARTQTPASSTTCEMSWAWMPSNRKEMAPPRTAVSRGP